MGKGACSRPVDGVDSVGRRAYHLGEGRVLKTDGRECGFDVLAYHLGEGRVLKTAIPSNYAKKVAYHLGEGRVLKTPQGPFRRRR